MLHPFDCKKSWDNSPSGLRSHWKLHEPHIRKMAPSTNKETGTSKKTVQRRWNGKSSGRTTVLHRPTSMNRNNNHKSPVLPVGARRLQSHSRIPLVRGGATENWLEERMDWPCPTTNCPTSPKCKESSICPQNYKQTMYSGKRPILHRKCNNPPKRNQKWRTAQTTRWIQMTQESIQWRKIPKATTAHHIGPCHRITPKCPSNPTSKIAPPYAHWTNWNAKIRRRTPKKRHHTRIMEPIHSKLLLH